MRYYFEHLYFIISYRLTMTSREFTPEEQIIIHVEGPSTSDVSNLVIPETIGLYPNAIKVDLLIKNWRSFWKKRIEK